MTTNGDGETIIQPPPNTFDTILVRSYRLPFFYDSTSTSTDSGVLEWILVASTLYLFYITSRVVSNL